MHCAQPCVQIVWSEVLSFMPGDRREPVVQIELRKPRPIAQPFELLAVQLVGEIDYAFSSVVELQPNLVVTEIPRIHHMTRHMLVLGHLPGPPGWLVTRTPSLHSQVTLVASYYPASKSQPVPVWVAPAVVVSMCCRFLYRLGCMSRGSLTLTPGYAHPGLPI